MMCDHLFHYPEIDMFETGKRIYSLCEEQGISASTLVRLFHIRNQSIYNWFSGKSLPSLDNMLALSILLDVPINDLIIYS